MKKIGILTKILSIVGTILVSITFLAPLFFGLFSLIGQGQFRFDYMMPAELFPLVLVGGALIIWATIRTHKYIRFVSFSLGIGVALLFIGQAIAVVTGMASGATDPSGWKLWLVMGMLIGFDLCVVSVAIGGVRLLKHVFSRVNLQP